MAERLARIVPELDTVVTHGKLKVEALDEAMIGFANGHGDVRLATNVIKSGPDVPRANTGLVWHADRFGLACCIGSTAGSDALGHAASRDPAFAGRGTRGGRRGRMTSSGDPLADRPAGIA